MTKEDLARALARKYRISVGEWLGLFAKHPDQDPVAIYLENIRIGPDAGGCEPLEGLSHD